MAWGRIDDKYRKHPKTLALLDLGTPGLEAIGAYWCIDSFCLDQHSETFTIWEAAMVVRRPHDDVRRILELLIKPPPGFERGFVLRKQTSSGDEVFEINSFAEYRSKNEAKAAAGAQGGKKSGEKRRAGSKQTRSTAEATAGVAGGDSEANTNLPIPIPTPDPGSRIPIPSPAAWTQGDPITSTLDLEVAVASWGWALQLKNSHRAEVTRLLAAGVITAHEILAARASTEGSKQRPRDRVAYFLAVVEGIRQEAAAIAQRGPGAPPVQEQPRGRGWEEYREPEDARG